MTEHSDTERNKLSLKLARLKALSTHELSNSIKFNSVVMTVDSEWIN